MLKVLYAVCSLYVGLSCRTTVQMRFSRVADSKSWGRLGRPNIVRHRWPLRYGCPQCFLFCDRARAQTLVHKEPLNLDARLDSVCEFQEASGLEQSNNILISMSAPSRTDAPQLSLEIPWTPQTHRIQLLSHGSNAQVVNGDRDEAAAAPTPPNHQEKTSDTLDFSNCPVIKLALCTEVLQELQGCFTDLSSNFSTAARRQLQHIVDDEGATFVDVSQSQPDLVMSSHCSLAHIRNTFERIKATYITHDRFALMQLYQAICEKENKRQRQQDASERSVPTAREQYLEAMKRRDAEHQSRESEKQEVQQVRGKVLASVQALWNGDRPDM